MPGLLKLRALLLACGALACGLLACSRDVATGHRCGASPTTPCGPSVSRSEAAGAAGRAGAQAGFGEMAAGIAGNDPVAMGSGALTVWIEDIEKMTIELVILQCAGDCAEVEAVAHGGHPPYAFAWNDGSTSAARRLCPAENVELEVSVTDTAIVGGEFPYDAHTASTTVTAQVLDCAGTVDGGTPVDTGVYWADWTSVTFGTPGSAAGTIALPSGEVQVSYAGEVASASQIGSGINNYFTPPATFLSATVATLPINNGIIAVSGDGTQDAPLTQTITFSEPVRDPLIALYSLGFGSLGVASTWQFDATPVILSSGMNASWFQGTLDVSGKQLIGLEGNGVAQFTGTFTTLSFTIPVVEQFPGWGGFTVGIRGR